MAKNRICSMDGCGKRTRGRGLCNAHYLRLVRHGSPDAGGTKRGAPWAFIEATLSHDAGDGCVLWPFGRNSNGYGQVYFSGGKEYAHRIVCQRVNGPAPLGHEAAHSCGKGHLGCISPRHLIWKTHAENAADTLVHGTRSRGDRHGRAVLSVDQVRKIRAMSVTSSPNEAAAMFGISSSHIRAIQTRKSWKWLD